MPFGGIFGGMGAAARPMMGGGGGGGGGNPMAQQFQQMHAPQQRGQMNFGGQMRGFGGPGMQQMGQGGMNTIRGPMQGGGFGGMRSWFDNMKQNMGQNMGQGPPQGGGYGMYSSLQGPMQGGNHFPQGPQMLPQVQGPQGQSPSQMQGLGPSGMNLQQMMERSLMQGGGNMPPWMQTMGR